MEIYMFQNSNHHVWVLYPCQKKNVHVGSMFFFRMFTTLRQLLWGALSHDKAPNLTLWRSWLQMLRWHHGQAPNLEG